ncbi:sensor histidine kinase [Paenibacillus sp. OAS669]|uniref:sensor histidine kinase n=1 Tax=Paenibacillus sp. OAS669 TaxID=2663821 RepID=UPI00178B520B|nr:ATP-binding protein [Paenibacillus sp. OAS669]MBE1442207.1 anti-sigma regulatory factor (Ser/Thr protein kinase) [Paenibacillus sp. OAS669]
MNFTKTIPLKTSLVFIIMIIALNTSYYLHYKTLLEDNQKEKMAILYSSIKTNMEQTAAGEKFVEDLIGENLRTAAIAAKIALDPDIHNIENQDLVELKKLIGVDEITLFARAGDDIVGQKSSDPKDLNVSSKGWDHYFSAFQQLFAREPVNVGIGQALDNYWSGPRDTATTSQSEINKWGYYYDGTTNYIINPFVHDTNFRKYQQITGVEDTIQRVMNDNPHIALEVAILNADKFMDHTLPESIPTPSNWFSAREVYFGSYDYRDPEEKQYAQLALTKDTTVFYVTESNGKSVMKSFTPIHNSYLKYNAMSSPPLIAITSDYSEVNNILHKHLIQIIWFMSVCTLLAVVIVFAIFWIFKRTKDRDLQDVQEAYVGNIETLFQSVREQRHDFINHIQTIHGFLALQNYDELRKYTNTLVGEIRVVNELVNLKDPALIALIQAKYAQAESLNIHFEYDFQHMELLKKSPIKATDVVKMLSNLIDNAFDATSALEPCERNVTVKGSIVNNRLEFIVRNTGPMIPLEARGQLFESGYSSKPSGKNSGLGLHIVKQLVSRYKGSVQYHSDSSGTEFVIAIPITPSL